jgi:hypothetical protein
MAARGAGPLLREQEAEALRLTLKLMRKHGSAKAVKVRVVVVVRLAFQRVRRFQVCVRNA